MEFNITRLGLLLKRKFLESGLNYVGGIAIGVGIVSVLSLLALLGGGVHLDSYYKSAFAAYFIGGLIVTSLAFAEINKPETGYQFMTLPASSSEKFITTWIFTSLVYSLIAFIIIICGSFLLSLVEYAGYAVRGPILDLSGILDVFLSYFFLNTIFLAGAAAFKRYAFFKTLLTFLILFFFFSICGAVLTYFIGAQNVTGGPFSFGFHFKGASGLEVWKHTGAVIQIIVMLYFLVLGFFKFKEREL